MTTTPTARSAAIKLIHNQNWPTFILASQFKSMQKNRTLTNTPTTLSPFKTFAKYKNTHPKHGLMRYIHACISPSTFLTV